MCAQRPTRGRKRKARRYLRTLGEAAGLPEGYGVTRYARDDESGCDRMWVERVGEPDRTCPSCGARGHLNGHYRRRVWHVPFRGGAQLALLLDQRRLRCPECGKSWSESHDGLVSRASRHMTAALAEEIKLAVMRRVSVKQCSAEYGPSRHLVNRVIDEALVDCRYLPQTLCIDEFKASTDAGKMAIGIYDGDAGSLVDMLPNMSRETVDAFFEGFSEAERRGVGFFCCDLSPEMIAVQRRWFPQAKLCLDRFHVLRLANESLSDVRLRVAADEDVDPKLRKELKHARNLLCEGRAKLRASDDAYAERLANRRAKVQATLALTDDELNALPGLRAREPREKKVERLLAASDDLKVAYALAHSLRQIHRAGKERWFDGMPKELEKWRSYARQSEIPELVACARTLNRNKEGILNSYRHDKTNAVAEGINNSIKVTKRVAYGMRRFESFRRRVLLALGIWHVDVVRVTLRDVSAEEG